MSDDYAAKCSVARYTSADVVGAESAEIIQTLPDPAAAIRVTNDPIAR